MSLSYTWQQFSTAVRAAVTSEETLQVRLENANAYRIEHVDEEGLTPELWARIEKLKETLAKPSVESGETSVDAGQAAIDTERAADLLREMFDIYEALSSEYYRTSES